jgi:hypothetical protein
MSEETILRGKELYKRILHNHQEIVKHLTGKDIYICTHTGEYTIGDGIEAGLALIEKVGQDKSPDFYSCRIGRLQSL